MAKAGFWLRGSRGKLAGASMGKGANGQTIIREIVAPKNPRTESQLVQRIIMKTVMQAYSTMKAITDHSFEGIAPGAATMAEFMRRNLNNIRSRVAANIAEGYGYDDIYAFTPLKSEQFAPNTYTISKGSLPVVTAAIDSSNDNGYISGIEENTYDAIISTYGLQRGDQLTFVSIQGTTPANTKFFFQRVILDPRNEDGSEAPLSSAFVGANGKVNLANPRNEGEFASLVYDANDDRIEWYNNRQLFNAAGVIVSRRDGQSWLRSECTLVLNTAGVTLWPTLGECLSQVDQNDINTRSKLYLNNAGTGRTAEMSSPSHSARVAYLRPFTSGQNTIKIGVDEDGKVLVSSTNKAIFANSDGVQIVEDYTTETPDGVDIQDAVSEWGSETISITYGAGGSGSFILPAKDGATQQEYVIDFGESGGYDVSPEITDYSA